MLFSLFHFSRVFPYIHPCLFPMEPEKAAAPAAATRHNLTSEQAAGTGVASPAPASAAPARAAVGAKRLRLLHRRHARNQRTESYTYSGVQHRPAW